MSSVCPKLFDAIARPVIGSSDSDEDVATKRLLVPWAVFATTVCAAFVPAYLPVDQLNDVALLAGFGCGVIYYTALLCGVRVKPATEALLLLFTIAAIIMDWYGVVVMGLRAWPIVVPLLQSCLVANVSNAAVNSTLGLLMVWLVFTSVEQTTIATDVLRDYGWRDGGVPTVCDCQEPPCPERPFFVLSSVAIYTLAVLLDFSITRGFAMSMRRQMRMVQASVSVSHEITVQLSRYEVEAAQEQLDGSGESLPPALLSAFQLLLANLKMYKPYLPQSCLAQCTEESEDVPGRDGSDDGVVKLASVPAFSSADLSDLRAVRMDSSCSYAEMPPDPGPRTPRVRRLSLPVSLHSTDSSPSSSIWREPRRRSVSLLETNRRGFAHAVAALSATGVGDLLRSTVEMFAETLQRHKGLVDLLSADHMLASFNASASCSSHRSAAVSCASAVTQHADIRAAEPYRLSAAVCAGVALCGDFGSRSTMRFMVVGSVSSMLPLAERMGTRWGAAVVCDGHTQSDVMNGWRCRLRCFVRYPKIGVRAALWQICGQRRQGSADSPHEWMYELMALEPDPWDALNHAMRKWVTGDVGALEAVRAAARDAVEAEVGAAAKDVAERLQAGAQPLWDVLQLQAAPPCPSCFEQPRSSITLDSPKFVADVKTDSGVPSPTLPNDHMQTPKEQV